MRNILFLKYTFYANAGGSLVIHAKAEVDETPASAQQVPAVTARNSHLYVANYHMEILPLESAP